MLNDALAAAVLEVERHVGQGGWDQPTRLFALVPTAELLAAAPELAAQLGQDHPEGHLSSIEQEDFHNGLPLFEALAHLAWPPTVAGCVLSVERVFLPSQYESELPEDFDEAGEAVASHPHRQELRLVTGVLRTGERHAVARVRSDPTQLLGGEDMAPGLSTALLATLSD
ncbi:MAG TPA: PPA1309 family protein [Propionibacteriaceae bacterium]|nr:PPA1309 family protein [Propionibacteriaceae bacterium]